MKKVAIFVEGYTEQKFVERYLEYAVAGGVASIEVRKQFQGVLNVVSATISPNPDVFILLVNCATDNQVKSQIIRQYNSLKNSNYSMIIGLRDIFPLSHADVDNIKQQLMLGLPLDSLPIQMHLSVLEIEAWFIQEHTHFARIDAKISRQDLTACGYDPDAIKASQLSAPADTLDKIYTRVGKRYKKKVGYINRTINSLCFNEIESRVSSEVQEVGGFLADLRRSIFDGAQAR